MRTRTTLRPPALRDCGFPWCWGHRCSVVGVGMLWSAFRKLERPKPSYPRFTAALWVAWPRWWPKETLFRYMLAVAKGQVQHVGCQCLARSFRCSGHPLVVALGIVGNLAGYPILDPIAALIVGFMVTKMGWEFGWRRHARPDGPRRG